jgi:hypothetical protein
MISIIAVAALWLSLIAVSGDATAQTVPGDVTFEVPVNLTRLSSYVSKVAVTCKFGMDLTVDREVYSNRVEFPVSAGQVVTTAYVVIPAPSSGLLKPGQKLNYECNLTALTSEPGAGSSWQPFDPKSMGDSLHISPTPLPIKSTFTW